MKATAIESRSFLTRWRRPASPTPEQLVEQSGLPSATGQFVLDLVRRTGGWRSERSELARELIDHFRDALENAPGGDALSEQNVIRAFGDPRQSAKLLRRAIRRKRTPLWAAWWFASRGIALVVALSVVAYLAMALRYYVGRPTIAIDYRPMIAERRDMGLESERAWSLYLDGYSALREVSLALATARSGDDPAAPAPLFDVWQPGSRAWEDAVRAVTEHSAAIESLRAAAERRVLGLRPGEFSDADAERLGGAPAGPAGPQDEWSASILSTRLVHLSPLRQAVQWLSIDASVAAAAGDGHRATENLIAAFRVAVHARGPFLVEQIVSNRLRQFAALTMTDVLARHPDAFDAEDLDRLAAALDAVDDEALRLDLAGERVLHADLVQRLYTDDGHGDGRLIWSAPATAYRGQSDFLEWTIELALAPLRAASMPSRREVLEAFDAWADDVYDLERRGSWTWTAGDLGLDDASLRAARTNTTGIHPPLVAALQPRTMAIVPLQATVRLALDQARVAVALRRFELAHGREANSLAELVPTFLRNVPRDPYDCAPLRSAVREGRLVVWSIGPDRVDDGLERLVPEIRPGHHWIPPAPPASSAAADSSSAGSEPSLSDAAPPTGDVRLWPPAE